MIPSEEVYIRLANNQTHFKDETIGVKIENGNLLLTTFRVIFYMSDGAVEVPLCYVKSVDKSVSKIYHNLFI